MKHLYNFSDTEIKVIYEACFAFRNSSTDKCSSEDLHALDGIIKYCGDRLIEAEDLTKKSETTQWH